jgi:hypothetical protein
MTKAQMAEKIKHMAHGIEKHRKIEKEYHIKMHQLQDQIERLEYRLNCAKEGRKFWRAEAKRLGTNYNYHAEALREEGRFVKVYTR